VSNIDSRFVQLEFYTTQDRISYEKSSIKTASFVSPSQSSPVYKTHATNKNISTEYLIGVLNWFAVHGTSLNNTNTLMSGDNKGYASYALEEYINKEQNVGRGGENIDSPSLNGRRFVAAFASTNLGDVSPNTAGPKVRASPPSVRADLWQLVPSLLYVSRDVETSRMKN